MVVLSGLAQHLLPVSAFHHRIFHNGQGNLVVAAMQLAHGVQELLNPAVACQSPDIQQLDVYQGCRRMDVQVVEPEHLQGLIQQRRFREYGICDFGRKVLGKEVLLRRRGEDHPCRLHELLLVTFPAEYQMFVVLLDIRLQDLHNEGDPFRGSLDVCRLPAPEPAVGMDDIRVRRKRLRGGDVLVFERARHIPHHTLDTRFIVLV